MGITVDHDVVAPGDEITGRLTDDDGRPLADRRVDLVATEGNATRSFPAGRPVRSVTDHDGRFVVAVPSDGAPTHRNDRSRGGWLVQHGDTAVPITVAHVREADLHDHLRSTAGTTPPRIAGKFREHLLSTGMALAFTGIWLALGIFLLLVEDPADGVRTIAVVCLAIAVIPIAITVMAVLSNWPRPVRGLEVDVTPTIVGPGDEIRVVARSDRRHEIALVEVETWPRIGNPDRILQASGALTDGTPRPVIGRPSVVQTETTEQRHWSGEVDGLLDTSVTVPRDATPTAFGHQIGTRWAIRAGGRKFLRWGPFRSTEWHVIVLDPDAGGPSPATDGVSEGDRTRR